MPTTTNFGWTTPADTDLVKDGASAIRTLGSNIDTSLVDLKGGTSGQYLTKNSNTDLDYAWVTLSAGGLTLLSTTTLSGTSTTISSISGSYTNLMVFVYGVNLSATNEFRLKPNNSSSVTDNNGTARQSGYGTGLVGESDGDIRLDFSAGTRNIGSANTNNFWSFTIQNYANATNYKTFFGNGGYANTDGDRVAFNEGGIFKSNTAISSLVFSAGGATFNAGTVLVYGAK